jgi:hypothetical protein
MESDCMQLAGDVKSPDLQAHFIRMAREWSSLAERDSVVDTEIKSLHEALDGEASHNLVAQDDGKQRAIDRDVTVVVEEAQTPELVHEVTDTRPRRANDFR